MFAVHNRRLTDAQIRQNFDVGGGQKYYLMFDISEHIPQCQGAYPNPAVDDPVRNPDHAPLCFIYLEAAQFDNGSYLFAYPRFVTLANTIDVNGVVIRNMRIGINGREATTGQAFSGINATIGPNFDHAVGQQLSSIGTVFALENGPQGATPDQFFLTFETLGNPGDLRVPTKNYTETFSTTPDAISPVEGSEVTVRSFEQINATMSAITTVNRNTTRINQNDVFDGTGTANDGTYTKVIQALPSTTDPSTFVTANQMAVTQLAIEYCNSLVDNVDNPNPAPRTTYFPGLTFNGATSPNLAFVTQAERDLVIDPLLTRVFNVSVTELTTMPTAAEVRGHLNTLINDLVTSADASNTCSGGNPCGFARTQTIIKSTCAAAVSSSAMLLQ